MKKTINIFLILFSVILLQNCDDEQFEPTLNYISFDESNYQSSIDPGSTTTKEINVYTTTVFGSDRAINLSVDEDNTSANVNSYTFPASVTVPANTNRGTFTIELADINLDCSNDLAFKLMPPEGIAQGNPATLTYYQKPSSSCASELNGSLDFVFDAYASEISYELRDVEGNVVISGPDSAFADGDVSTNIPITLCEGRCYSLVVMDSFGDGLAAPGAFTLTINGKDYVEYVFDADDGNFGDSSSTIFQVL
ncbi:hypothetical protein [Algibacter sp. 2305UL17-15]|uniref:hypothetical protein n=1 Tax=Algibacter sp. 2305UL17-15 TaxID=3231268 RepID=UPI003459602C